MLLDLLGKSCGVTHSLWVIFEIYFQQVLRFPPTFHLKLHRPLAQLSDFIQRNHYVDRQDFLPANINNFLTAPVPEESGMRFATRTWIRIDVHEVFKIVANHDIVAVEGGQS